MSSGSVDDLRERQSRVMELADLLTPWAVRTAATLRLADRIAAGVIALPALADATGTDEAALGDLLGLLCARGLFTESVSHTFGLTELGEVLRDDHPARFRQKLDMNGGMARSDVAFSRLIDSVRTGGPAYHLVFGRSFWEDLDGDPALRSALDGLLDARLTGQAAAVAEAYDWSPVTHVVDVGGGSSLQLQTILGRSETLRGTLVERPATAAAAATRLREAGFGDRATVEPGSFFDELPSGADAYLLSDVLHNWPDADAARILGRCAEAVSPGGRIIIVESVAATERKPYQIAATLRMLVTFGGRERRLAEFHALAEQTGLRVARVIDTPFSFSIIECRPRG